MHNIYTFLTGPMVWIAVFVFIGGSLYKLISMYNLAKSKEPVILEYMSLKYGLRSIIRWSIPFATTNMRIKPILTTVTFIFHYCLVLLPIFLSAHIVLFEQAWDIRIISLPDCTADIMTIIVIAACVFFAFRRITQKEVSYLTTPSDFFILLIVAMPFISGFLAYHQVGNYLFFINLHIFSGEIMLIAIPFTRLSHMIFAPFTRAYIGSEFGGVRHAKDW